VRRVLNARPGTEHHASAFYLAEASLKLAASVRISVALETPELLDAGLRAKLEAIVLPSLGHWVSFFADSNRALVKSAHESPPVSALRSAARDLTKALPKESAMAEFIEAARGASIVGDERAKSARKEGVIGFFEALVAYRNVVLGHGALRSHAFYERFAAILRRAMVEALGMPALLAEGELVVPWSDGGADPDAAAKWKALSGLAGIVSDDSAAGFAAQKLYVRLGTSYVSLHPLVVVMEDDFGHERFGFLNRAAIGKKGDVRKADYLDYATGEDLEGVDARAALMSLLSRIRGERVTTEEVNALEATLLADSKESSDAPREASESESRVGHVLGGKYELRAVLGEGGMATVYDATHVDLGERRVALKVLHPDLARRADIVDRFRSEARAVSALDHPAVVTVTDFGREPDGTVYFVMEKLKGQPLDRWVERTQPSYSRIVTAIIEALDGLSFAHERKLVHRDLKPQNLFIATDASGAEKTKLLDFGIAKVLSAERTTTEDGMLLGTPHYMSPEQIKTPGKVDGRSDIYSMGATLYQLIVGIPPVSGETSLEIVSKVTSGDVHRHPRELRSDVPQWLDAIVAKAMAISPDDRFASARDMKTALEQGERGSSLVERSPASVSDRTSPAHTAPAVATTLSGAHDRGARSSSNWLVLGGLALTAGIGLLAIKPMQHRATEETPRAATAQIATESASSAPAADASASSAPGKLREPTIGLRAIEAYRHPSGSDDSALDWVGAREDLEDAAKQSGAPVQWSAGAKLAEGLGALDKGHADEAVATLEEAGRIDPTWALPPAGLASALVRQGHYDQALEAARRAERLDPDWTGAIVGEARADQHAGQLNDAMKAYGRALKLAPKDARIIAALALVYHAANNDAAANEYASRALAIDPNLVAVHLILAEAALEKNDGAEALKHADIAAKADLNQTAVLLARADALAILHRKKEAIEAYKAAIQAYLASGDRAQMPKRLADAEKLIQKDELPPPRWAPSSAPSGGEHQRTHCDPGDPLCQ